MAAIIMDGRDIPPDLIEYFEPVQDNLKSVFAVNPGSFSGAHFATMPPALVSPCILAGTSARGACPTCGAPWERVVERRQGSNQEWAQDTNPSEKETRLIEAGDRCGHGKLNRGSKADYYANAARSHTLGWRPGCECGTLHRYGTGDAAIEEIEPPEPVPCTVLDPFVGAGTTPMVAESLGRDSIGIDLSGEYIEMARRRIEGVKQVELPSDNGDAPVTVEQGVLIPIVEEAT